MEFAKFIFSLGEKDRELVFDIVYISCIIVWHRLPVGGSLRWMYNIHYLVFCKHPVIFLIEQFILFLNKVMLSYTWVFYLSHSTFSLVLYSEKQDMIEISGGLSQHKKYDVTESHIKRRNLIAPGVLSVRLFTSDSVLASYVVS